MLQNGEWGWITGEAWKYTNWQSGEPGCCAPDEYWLDFNVGSGAWRDRQQCVAQYPDVLQPGIALVEWSADCNDDGIVDYGQILDGTYPDDDGNGVPDCCDDGVPCDGCLGDITGNGVVDAADLGILLAVWGSDGKSNPEADLNGDGIVDAADLGLVLGAWGPCEP